MWLRLRDSQSESGAKIFMRALVKERVQSVIECYGSGDGQNSKITPFLRFEDFLPVVS